MAKFVYVGCGVGDDEQSGSIAASAIIADEKHVAAMYDRVAKLAAHHGEDLYNGPRMVARTWDSRGRPLHESVSEVVEIVDDLVDAVRDCSLSVRCSTIPRNPPENPAAGGRDSLLWNREAPLWEQALRSMVWGIGGGEARHFVVADDRLRPKLDGITMASEIGNLARTSDREIRIRSFIGPIHYVDGRTDAGILLADMVASIKSHWPPPQPLDLEPPMDRLVRQWQNRV